MSIESDKTEDLHLSVGEGEEGVDQTSSDLDDINKWMAKVCATFEEPAEEAPEPESEPVTELEEEPEPEPESESESETEPVTESEEELETEIEPEPEPVAESKEEPPEELLGVADPEAGTIDFLGPAALDLSLHEEIDPFAAPAAEPEVVSEQAASRSEELEVAEEVTTEVATPAPEPEVAPAQATSPREDLEVAEEVATEVAAPEVEPEEAPTQAEPSQEEPAQSAEKITEEVATQAPEPIDVPPTLKTPTPKPAERKPGGRLRDIESALAETKAQVLTPEIGRRASAAVRFLATIENVERATVLIQVDGKLQAVAAGGFKETDTLAQIPRHLIGHVMSTNRSMMLIDFQKDTRFNRGRRIEGDPVRSVICVPFTDLVSGLSGLLYVDSVSRGDAFSYSDLDNVEKFASLLATQLELGQWEVAPVREDTFVEVDREPTSPWPYVLGLLLVAILMVPALTNKDDQFAALEDRGTVAPESADPETVLRSFVYGLETGGYSRAYELLSEDKRRQISSKDFEKRVKEFVRRSENKSFTSMDISLARSLSDGSQDDDRREYLLRTRGSDLEPWRWGLRRHDDTWYIDSLKGGPTI